MKHLVLFLILSVGLISCGFGQETTEAKKFELFACASRKGHCGTQKSTKTLISTETHVRNRIYAVYWSRTEPKQELFRIEIGRYLHEEPIKWWNYGITDEADFNGDGKPDYSWYGGDDTSEDQFLFLSSSDGYKQVDITKTVAAAWKQKYNETAPDFAALDSKYRINQVMLERTATDLSMNITVHYSPDSLDKKGKIKPESDLIFKINQTDFQP